MNRFPRRARTPRLEPAPINMAHIRVAGVGGLGLIAIAVVTAFVLPDAGIPVASGLILGVVLAGVLILWRSRRRQTPTRRTLPR